jgi:hypothetical protein
VSGMPYVVCLRPHPSEISRALERLMRLLSDPNARWEGFRPVSYWLYAKILELPLTQKLDDGKTDEPTTIGVVYNSLKGKQITPESGRAQLATTDGAKFLLGGPDFNLRMLDVMLRLRAEGIDPFMTGWFYYTHDHCLKDVDESYSFFIVHDERIVREQVTLFDDPHSGFDPSVFGTDDLSDPVWSDAEAVSEASAKYWYRKFYSETPAGQLMVLRSDHPKLFYHDELREPDVMGALGTTMARTLDGIRTLLWVLVIVTVLSVIIRWR